MMMSFQVCSLKFDGRVLVFDVREIFEMARDLPIKEIPISHFDLKEMTWFINTEEVNLQSIVDHFKRTQSADLSIPLILSPDGHVLDGTHRLVKGILEGRRRVACVRLDRWPSELNGELSGDIA